MVVEAGAVAGYVIAWLVQKTRRAAERLDAKVDAAVDACLERLYELVAARLDGHPVLDDLTEEVATADGQVSELTRQQLELAVKAAARKDNDFGQAVTELLARVCQAEIASGGPAVSATGSTVFTGDVHIETSGDGVVIGQIAGDVNLNRDASGRRQEGPFGFDQPSR